MSPQNKEALKDDVPVAGAAALSVQSTANNNDDQSKWSKSKKKRMRMKKTKIEKRMHNNTVDNKSAGGEQSSASNSESNNGIGKGRSDISSPRKPYKPSSDSTANKDEAVGNSQKRQRKNPTTVEEPPTATAALDASNNDQPKINKQAVAATNNESKSSSTSNVMESREVKKKQKKCTKKEDGKDGEEYAAPPNALASTCKVEAEESPREVVDLQEPKQKPTFPPTEDKKRKLDQDNANDRGLSNNNNTTNTTLRRPGYSFQVDDTDHCETPLQAYRDVVDILDQLAKALTKTRSSLIIYDPYYCDGGIKKKLASLGFTNCINNNRDFYTDIKKKTTPEYDILVTNPPYSGVHMAKLLTYCADMTMEKKPFLLLLPHFVYTKDYYKRALASTRISSSMFFLVPERRYEYIPPSWVTAENGSNCLADGKMKTAPFPSFWYCRAPSTETNMMISPTWLVEQFGPSGMVRPKHHSKLRYAKCSNDIPRDFRGEFDPNNKRANPKARKRLAKMKREAASRAGGGGY